MGRDLERMALGFARDLLSTAWRAEALGADALTDLRGILEDTLTRIKDEVFGDQGARPRDAGEAGDDSTRDGDRPATAPDPARQAPGVPYRPGGSAVRCRGTRPCWAGPGRACQRPGRNPAPPAAPDVTA